MSTKTMQLDDRVMQYLHEATLRESDVLRRLREETAQLPDSNMQISAEQGQFMRLLVELVGAQRALEIGTFTGYSAICVAEALPANGILVACDTSDEWTNVARRYWQEAGLADKIQLHLRPAVETLDELIANGEAGSFDFSFIDADKQGYDGYYERSLELLRPGGLVAIDNALWSGKVADPETTDPDTAALRALNRKVRQDDRVTMSLVPIGDGLLLARKRAN